MTKIKERYTDDRHYRDAETNGVFIDNHDVKRFLNDAFGKSCAISDKWPQFKAALGFLSSIKVPSKALVAEMILPTCQPANRENVVFNANHELYQYIAKLNRVRTVTPLCKTAAKRKNGRTTPFSASSDLRRRLKFSPNELHRLFKCAKINDRRIY